MAKFDKSVLEKYGITGTTEVLYNPSYEVLFNEETKESLQGYERGQENDQCRYQSLRLLHQAQSPDLFHSHASCFFYFFNLLSKYFDTFSSVFFV